MRDHNIRFLLRNKKNYHRNFLNSPPYLDLWHIYHISSAIRWSFFSFQNNLKNLDPSYKMDLDLWDCLGRVKLVI